MKRTITNGDEPSFDLPVENELLMLKLRAEFGAECITGGDDIPPVVVNDFLKSVYEFEQKFREPRELIKIYDKIPRLSEFLFKFIHGLKEVIYHNRRDIITPGYALGAKLRAEFQH